MLRDKEEEEINSFWSKGKLSRRKVTEGADVLFPNNSFDVITDQIPHSVTNLPFLLSQICSILSWFTAG